MAPPIYRTQSVNTGEKETFGSLLYVAGASMLPVATALTKQGVTEVYHWTLNDQSAIQWQSNVDKSSMRWSSSPSWMQQIRK